MLRVKEYNVRIVDVGDARRVIRCVFLRYGLGVFFFFFIFLSFLTSIVEACESLVYACCSVIDGDFSSLK
jgi:hypothetical protein